VGVTILSFSAILFSCLLGFLLLARFVDAPPIPNASYGNDFAVVRSEGRSSVAKFLSAHTSWTSFRTTHEL